MKHTLILFALSIISLAAVAQTEEGVTTVPSIPSDSAYAIVRPTTPVTKAEADSAYAAERYDEAIALYRQLTDSLGESAQIYYNLGNCYYRQDSIARAILYYERSLLLDPSNDDTRFNLDIARSKTVDRVVPASEMFFLQLFHSLILSQSISRWAIMAIAAFVLALICLALYFFMPGITAKKLSFTAAVLLFLVCIFANIAAFEQRSHIQNRTEAIIMAPSAVVKSTPSVSGTDLFILHEGTHVHISDNSMRDYVEVQLTDGKQGWIPRELIEII